MHFFRADGGGAEAGDGEEAGSLMESIPTCTGDLTTRFLFIAGFLTSVSTRWNKNGYVIGRQFGLAPLHLKGKQEGQNNPRRPNCALSPW